MSWFSDIWKHVKGAATGGLSYLNDGFDEDDIDPLHMFTKNDSEELADDQWEWQQLKYDENFQFQREQYDYQKMLNDLAMQREDTAVQRRVADLKASGLSPTLAAGSAADSGAMHAGQAPQYEVGVNPKLEAAMFKQSMTKDMIELASSVLGNVANIARTGAETQLIKAQTDKLVGETPVDLKLKELEQKFNESTVESRINQIVNNETIQNLQIINDSLNNVLTENRVAMQAFERQKLENEAKIAAIEAKYADDHKRLENELLKEQVKEKSVAVTLAEHIRDWENANDIPISAMSPVAKTFWPLTKGFSGKLLGSEDNPASGDRPKSWFLGKSYEWWHKKRDWSAPVINYFKKFGKGGPFDFSD